MAEMNNGAKGTAGTNSAVIRAAWLFPDILYIHGERGNLLALERVAGFAGADVVIDRVDFDRSGFDPMNYDFIFCPPGEIASFTAIVEWLMPYRDQFEAFVEAGRVMLVTGTSQCIFGGRTVREDGSVLEGLGLIDCDFTERKMVYGDDLYFMTSYGCQAAGGDAEASGDSEASEGSMEIFGSQIQMMDVESREEPFGQLKYGFGNTGKDRKEGSVKKNCIFTNTLGPIFVLNPWLTKKVVVQCLRNVGIEIEDFDFDVSLEKKSLETKKLFTNSKVTKLSNCK